MYEDVIPGDSPIAVRGYRRALQDRWKWVVLGVVVGVVGAGGFLLLATPSYTVSTVVAVQPISNDPFGTNRSASGLVDMAMEGQLAESWTTAHQAAEELGSGWDAASLMAATNVSGTDRGAVLRVSCTQASSERAVKCADAVAEAYLTVRSARANTLAASLTDALDKRIDALSEELVAASTGEPSSTRADILRTELAALVSQRTSLSPLSSHAGDVITPASSTGAVRSPNVAIVLAVGLVGGLILGLLGALLRDRYATRLTSSGLLSDIAPAPVWAPDAPDGDQRWGTATELFGYTADGKRRVVLAASDHPASLRVAERLAEVPVGAESVQVTSFTTVAEALAAVRLADGVVVVLEPRYRRDEAEQLFDLLLQTGKNVLGVILTDASDEALTATDTSPDVGRGSRSSVPR